MQLAAAASRDTGTTKALAWNPRECWMASAAFNVFQHFSHICMVLSIITLCRVAFYDFMEKFKILFTFFSPIFSFFSQCFHIKFTFYYVKHDSFILFKLVCKVLYYYAVSEFFIFFFFIFPSFFFLFM